MWKYKITKIITDKIQNVENIKLCKWETVNIQKCDNISLWQCVTNICNPNILIFVFAKTCRTEFIRICIRPENRICHTLVCEKTKYVNTKKGKIYVAYWKLWKYHRKTNKNNIKLRKCEIVKTQKLWERKNWEI